jgi:oligo-1,6-glucosidase
VGECWGANIENIRNLTGEERGELTTVFQFEHINRNCRSRFEPKEFSLSEFHDVFVKWQNITQDNDLIYTLFIENHDQGRCISRFADDGKLRYESATMFATMLYGMRGIPFIYQGQEIGVTNSRFDKIEDFDDMETTAFYRAYKDKLTEEELFRLINFGTRDNARHPMAWDASVNGGFNDGAKPWLPPHPEYSEINVAADKASEKSIFRYYKDIIALRKANEVLRQGIFEDMTNGAENYFMYRRKLGEDEMVIVCNYAEPSKITLPDGAERLIGNYPEHAEDIFSPYEAGIYKIKK